MKKSNCCQASIIDNSDICSQCKEHCEVVVNVGELKEEIEHQVAALIHIASSCGDQGVAICIENVCWKLELIADSSTFSIDIERAVRMALERSSKQNRTFDDN